MCVCVCVIFGNFIFKYENYGGGLVISKIM